MEIIYFSPPNLATLRLCGSNVRHRMLSASRSFAQAMQILSYSNTKDSYIQRRSGFDFQIIRTFVFFVNVVVSKF